jgi:hypothetical protein
MRRQLLVVLALLGLGVGATADEAGDAARPEAAQRAPAREALAGGERSRTDGDLYGFELEKVTVPAESIVPGGPGRDGIKAVDAPEFRPVEEATWVQADTPVLGVSVDGVSRAYPVHLLEYHQIVNDTVNEVPIAVTYDPLTATPRVFRRKVEGRVLTLGVSGLLYNSGFLMYDRETESLWSQFRGVAVSGSLSGVRLPRIRVVQVTVESWLREHPDTQVLVRPEKYRIDYRVSPFTTYMVRDSIPFPVAARDDRYHPKRLVVGLVADGASGAILDSAVTKAGGSVEHDFQGRVVRVRYDPNAAVFTWEAPDDVEVTEGYWFAWKAFHPDTQVLGDTPARPE